MPAALPRSPQGIRYPASCVGLPALEVSLFIDLCCPFSAKIYDTTMKVMSTTKIEGVQAVFHMVPQPWHPQSCTIHEFSLAVREVAGAEAFFTLVKAIFDQQPRYFDDKTYGMSRKEIHEDLMSLAIESGVFEGGKETEKQVREFIAIPAEGGNCGNKSTQLIKLAAKYHRRLGVHVTPTVFINGIEAADVGSSWTVDAWHDKLDAI